MGASILSARSTRRIARTTGLDVVRAWSHGKYWMPFVTADHRHGIWHRYSHEVHWYDPGSDGLTWFHYGSCQELFPADFNLSEGEA